MRQPKYLDLANRLRADIVSGKYNVGQKLPSENELSQKLSLSRQTVRQALNTLDKDGILERRQGSGTYVALRKHGNQRPTKNIGIISTYTDSYIFPAIIKGIDAVLSEKGYTMQLSLTRNLVENEASALTMLLENNVDGLILEPTKSGLPCTNIELYRLVESRNIPTVFFNAHYPNLNFQYVCMDDRLAGYKAARHLIDCGHTRIAGMFKSDDRQGQLRYLGFMEALKESGLKHNGILWFATEDIPYIAEDITRVKRCVCNSTGLLCYNDQIAFPVVSALIAGGFAIPDELSVIGIDNAQIASFCEVPLTTLAHPMERLGKAAAQGVLNLIGNPEEQVTVEFEPELIIRESVKNLSIL